MKVRTIIVALGALASTICVANAASGKDVIVEVNGTAITFAELQQKKPVAVFKADTNYYEGERQAIEELINDVLLQQQAIKEGLTVDQLLDKHVKGTIAADPSEEALRVYFEGLDTTQTYEAVRGQILDSLRERRITKAKSAYMQSLRKQANVILRVAPPRAPISMAGVPKRGADKAPVLLLEFADYECPVCQQVQPVVAKLEKEFGDKVAFAYKDFPLNIHANAEKAAEATHCAEAQGKYWEYHDKMYAEKRVEPDALKQFAQDLKLDTAAFDKCLDTGAKAAEVKISLDEANKMSLPGTPSFFVNGRYVSGNVTYEKLHAMIAEELSAAENSANATHRGLQEK